LARTTLKDQELAETDVVCWDGNGLGDGRRLGRGYTARCRTTDGGTPTTYGNVNLFPVMMVVVITTEYTVGSTVKTMTEGVVMTLFIVVTHLVFFGSRWIDCLFCNTDFLPLCRLETRSVDCFFDSNVFAVGRLESRSVLTFCKVYLGIVSAAMRKLDVNLSVVMLS